MKEIVNAFFNPPAKVESGPFGTPQEFYKALESASTDIDALGVLKKLAEQAQQRVPEYRNDPRGAIEYACTYVEKSLQNKTITNPQIIEFWKKVIAKVAQGPIAQDEKKLLQ